MRMKYVLVTITYLNDSGVECEDVQAIKIEDSCATNDDIKASIKGSLNIIDCKINEITKEQYDVFVNQI